MIGLKQPAHPENGWFVRNESTLGCRRKECTEGERLCLVNRYVQSRHTHAIQELIELRAEIGVIQQLILVRFDFGERHTIRSNTDHQPKVFVDHITKWHSNLNLPL